MELYNCIHLPVAKYGYYDIADAPPTVISYLEGLRANLGVEEKVNIHIVTTPPAESLGDFFIIALSKIANQRDEHGRTGLMYYHVVLIKKPLPDNIQTRAIEALYERKYHGNIDNEVEKIINITIHSEFSKAKDFIKSYYITENDILSLDASILAESSHDPIKSLHEQSIPTVLGTSETSRPNQMQPLTKSQVGSILTGAGSPPQASTIETPEPELTKPSVPGEPTPSEAIATQDDSTARLSMEPDTTASAVSPTINRVSENTESTRAGTEPNQSSYEVLLLHNSMIVILDKIDSMHKELRKTNYFLILITFLMLALAASIVWIFLVRKSS